MTASGRKALSSNSGNNGENKNNNNNNNNNSLSRKASKPLMEKRRRARINESLTELKNIVVIRTEKNGSGAKLEKADILEMTVKYLRELCESQRGHTWRDGFEECLKKTTRFLHGTGHSELSTEITLHLESVCSEDEIESSSSEIEPINLAVYNGLGREESFVWRPW